MSSSFRIKYRIATDELSLVAKKVQGCKKKQQRRRRQIQLHKSDINSATSEEPSLQEYKSNDDDSDIQFKRMTCPSVPETVYYYEADRQRQAKNQASKIGAKSYKHAKLNAMRIASIVPTAKAMTPEKRRRRQKGEIPCDRRSLYVKERNNRTKLRKLKQNLKVSQGRKTARHDLYDTSDEESELSMNNSRPSKKEKLYSSSISAASLGQKRRWQRYHNSNGSSEQKNKRSLGQLRRWATYRQEKKKNSTKTIKAG